METHQTIHPHVPTSEEMRHVEFILEESASADHGYKLNINFLPEDQSRKIEQIFAVFRPLNPSTIGNNENLLSFIRRIEQLHPNKIVDIYPLNGTSNKKRNVFLKNLIRASDYANLQSHIELLRNESETSLSLFVLDIKDKSGKYANSGEICEAESSVAQFFKNEAPKEDTARKKVHQLLKSERIRYFIAEGSLKARLIREVLTEKQARFFQDITGRGLLCQLCEFIMNGFKQGYEVQISQTIFHPGDYIRAIDGEQKGHLPTDLSCWNTIKLQTFYSPEYKQLYSSESDYFKTINHLFYAEYNYDEKTQTTIITLQ